MGEVRVATDYIKIPCSDTGAILAEIRERCIVADRAITMAGSLSLHDYAAAAKAKEAHPLQDRKDFQRLAAEYCRELLGQEAAEEIEQTLGFPMLATANHHGVDFSPQTLQGDILYWKMLCCNGLRPRYLPLCSFGMVSLRNSSYARGLMIHTLGSGRIRLPIFPKSMENRMVRYTKGYTRANVEAAIHIMQHEYSQLSSAPVILRILEEIYLSKDILGLERYGDQAVLINQRLGRLCFKGKEFPDIIYLETEQITEKLFVMDMQNEKSLLHIILTDKKILEQLHGKDYCDIPMSRHFFWGADEEGRRCPLDLTADGQLRGKTLRGENICMPADAKNLIKLVQNKEIVPAGYSIAIMLCFARGYTWMGGCFQGGYLPVWQNLTAQSLTAAGFYEHAENIMQYDCTGYVCGPIFALAKTDDGMANPAGFVELMQAGGLSFERLNELLDVTVAESHEMGLLEFYGDLVPAAERQENWSSLIARCVGEKYRKYIV